MIVKLIGAQIVDRKSMAFWPERANGLCWCHKSRGGRVIANGCLRKEARREHLDYIYRGSRVSLIRALSWPWLIATVRYSLGRRERGMRD